MFSLLCITAEILNKILSQLEERQRRAREREITAQLEFNSILLSERRENSLQDEEGKFKISNYSIMFPNLIKSII